MSSKRIIVQPGETTPCDLFLYAHVGADFIREEASHATRDAVVAEFWGQGTVAYKALMPAYGGFKGWVAGLETKLSKKFRRVCLTTWSAGSQVAEDVCKGNDWPDALVMLDGLYAPKPEGSKPGDGKVVFDDGLKAVANFALAAARGERICVILHSNIQTPYASSGECAKAILTFVEGQLGEPLEDVKETIGPKDKLGPMVSAKCLRNLTIIEYGGANGAEHVREAHLFDEVWKRFIPWASDESVDTAERVIATLPADIRIGVIVKEDAAKIRDKLLASFPDRDGLVPQKKDPKLQVVREFGSILGSRFDVVLVEDGVDTQSGWFKQCVSSRLVTEGRLQVVASFAV